MLAWGIAPGTCGYWVNQALKARFNLLSPVGAPISGWPHFLIRRSTVACTLCLRAVRAKHTDRELSSPGVNTTPAYRA
jgi:hypothetical protein